MTCNKIEPTVQPWLTKRAGLGCGFPIRSNGQPTLNFAKRTSPVSNEVLRLHLWILVQSFAPVPTHTPSPARLGGVKAVTVQVQALSLSRPARQWDQSLSGVFDPPSANTAACTLVPHAAWYCNLAAVPGLQPGSPSPRSLQPFRAPHCPPAGTRKV